MKFKEVKIQKTGKLSLLLLLVNLSKDGLSSIRKTDGKSPRLVIKIKAVASELEKTSTLSQPSEEEDT